MAVKEGQALRVNGSEDRTAATFWAGGYVPGAEPGIACYDLDTGSGTITRRHERAGVPFPAFLALSPDGRSIYAVSETTSLASAAFGTDRLQTRTAGTVWSFRLTRHGLAAPQHRSSGGELPTHLTVHPTGRWLVASNYGCGPNAGSVAVFALDADGSLGELAALSQHDGQGPVTSRQASSHVHSTSFTPAGDELVAADLGADALVVYGFDVGSGALQRQRSYATPRGWGPRYMRWTPDGQTLFVVGELAAEVGMFGYDRTAHEFDLLARVPTVSDNGAPDVLPSDIHLDPERRLLYVANRGAVNSIATIRFDPHGSSLALVGEVPTHGVWPRAFAVSPDRQALVVANQHSDNITVLGLDTDGFPSERRFVMNHAAASFIGFQPVLPAEQAVPR